MTGGAYYSWFKGTADAKMMQHACFHAMVIGNHEFDDGDQNLATFIDNLSDAAVCATEPKYSARTSRWPPPLLCKPSTPSRTSSL